MSVTVGSKGRSESVVTEHNTACAVGSGLVPFLRLHIWSP